MPPRCSNTRRSGSGPGALRARSRRASEHVRNQEDRGPRVEPGALPFPGREEMAALKIRPDEGRFLALASEWPLVPVWTELLADVSTPVGIFPSLAGDGPGVLLEGVEPSRRRGRESFLA